MKSTLGPALLLLLLPLVASHFTLDSPKARGFDEDKLGTFPCGSQDTVGSRTPFPIAGGPIQLTMEHDRSLVQVLLAIGNDVGDHFNIILQPTLQEQGLGSFCMKDVVVPSSLNITDGQNATIQVVTNGDPAGGLYNCADITFRSSAQAGECNNGRGVGSTAYTGKANANGTDASGVLSASGSSTSSSASGTASATSTPSGTAPAPAATSSHTSSAGAVEMGGWGFLAVVGAAMALL